jgi:hypothetical protein
MMTDQLTGNGDRWTQRIAVDIPVQVAAHHGHLKNLSLSGALMETDHELRLHAYIEVNIKLPETGRSPSKSYGAGHAEIGRRRLRRMVRFRTEYC